MKKIDGSTQKTIPSVKKEPGVYSKDEEVLFERQYAELKRRHKFEALTDLINFPIEIAFQAWDTTNCREFAHDSAILQEMHDCALKFYEGHDGSGTPLPLSRNNRGVHNNSSDILPRHIFPKAFVFRCYEFFSVNIHDAFGTEEPSKSSNLIKKDFSTEWDDVTNMGTFPIFLQNLKKPEKGLPPSLATSLPSILPKIIKGYLTYGKNGAIYKTFNHLTFKLMSDMGILDHTSLVADCYYFLALTLAWNELVKHDDTREIEYYRKSQPEVVDVLANWYEVADLDLKALELFFPLRGSTELRDRLLEHLDEGLAIVHTHMLIKRALLRSMQLKVLLPALSEKNAAQTLVGLSEYEKSHNLPRWSYEGYRTLNVTPKVFSSVASWLTNTFQSEHVFLSHTLRILMRTGDIAESHLTKWVKLDLISNLPGGTLAVLKKAAQASVVSPKFLLNMPHLPIWSNRLVTLSGDLKFVTCEKFRRFAKNVSSSAVTKEVKMLAKHVSDYKGAILVNPRVAKDANLKSFCIKEQKFLEIWSLMKCVSTFRKKVELQTDEGEISVKEFFSRCPRQGEILLSSGLPNKGDHPCDPSFHFECDFNVTHDVNERAALTYENEYRSYYDLESVHEEYQRNKEAKKTKRKTANLLNDLIDELSEEDSEVFVERDGKSHSSWDESSCYSDEDDDYDPKVEKEGRSFTSVYPGEEIVDFENLPSDDPDEDTTDDEEDVVHSDEDVEDHKPSRRRPSVTTRVVTRTSSGRLSKSALDLDLEEEKFKKALKKKAPMLRPQFPGANKPRPPAKTTGRHYPPLKFVAPEESEDDEVELIERKPSPPKAQTTPSKQPQQVATPKKRTYCDLTIVCVEKQDVTHRHPKKRKTELL